MEICDKCGERMNPYEKAVSGDEILCSKCWEKEKFEDAKMNLKTRIKLEWEDKTMWLSTIIGVWGGLVCISLVEFIILLTFKKSLPLWFILSFAVIYTLIIYGKMYNYFDSMKKEPENSLYSKVRHGSVR